MTDIMTRKLAPSADAAESRVGDEIVILHLKSGIYFGLDRTGTRVWAALKAGATASDICDSLAAEHDVDRATVECDVRKFLTDLDANAMVEDG